MKYLVFMFFFGLSFSAFSANNAPDLSLTIMESVAVKEEVNVQLNNQNTTENAVAFDCYYTVEWLYRESPFIEKLEAFA